MSETKIALAKPLKLGEELIVALALREPTGRDVRELGWPMTISSDGVTFRADVALEYAARLAGLPPPVLDDLSPADCAKIIAAVVGFFGATPETTDSSTGASR